MKVLHIIGNLETGGAEKLLVDTLPLLNSQKDFKADLLLFDGKKTPFLSKLSETGTSIISLGSGLYNPILIFKLIPYLKRYDIVHVHLFPAQYFVVFAKFFSFSKTPLVFSEHSTGNRRMSHPLFKIIDRFIYKSYAKVICITQQVKEVLINHLAIPLGKLVVLNNGVDIKQIERASKYNRNDYGFSPNDKLIIMVAGFRIEKDQRTVIKALANLPENYKLILVGDGKGKSESEELALSLNLKDRVFFYGVRTDVYSLMKMCDIAVLSSHWEGFGLSAIESMACGLPTIVSNVPGLAQTVGNAALIFGAGSTPQLVAEIKNIFGNKSLFETLAQKAQVRAKQFDIKLMIDKQVLLYQSMIV